MALDPGKEVPRETLKAFRRELEARATLPIKIDGKDYYPFIVEPRSPLGRRLAKGLTDG